MIEVVLRDYLMSELEDDIYVGLEKPEVKPSTYVILHKMDAGRTDHIDAATFSITCVAKTLYGVTLLANRIKELLFGSVSLSQIAASKMGGENVSAVASESSYEAELIFNFTYYEED